MRAPHHLLLRALFQPLPEAERWWRRWRTIVNLDKLDRGSFYTLPALAGCMHGWIQDDPYREILLGICRRAWSQKQIRKKVLAEALSLLRASGIGAAAAIGPLAWEQLYWPAGAIRMIEGVDLVVEPGSVSLCMQAFLRSGWTVHGRPPDWNGSKFYFAAAIRMRTDSGEEVRLHWRDLPNTDFALRRPDPPEFKPTTDERATLYTPSAARDLVLALGGVFDDGLDWRCDALMICRSNVEWNVVETLLKWRSRAKMRLAELRRDWGVQVPQIIVAKLYTASVERMVTAPLRAYRHAKLKLLERRVGT